MGPSRRVVVGVGAAMGAATTAALTTRWSQRASADGDVVEPASVPERVAGERVWHDVADWPLEGRPWSDLAAPFDRLPARAQATVPDRVWELSRHPSGMLARWQSDSPTISVRYSLGLPELDRPHVPATGVSGVDLYADDGRGRSRWVACSRPTATEVEVDLVRGLSPRPRDWGLYLPLHNRLTRLSIGLEPGSRLVVADPRGRPVVFYGTSIIHGVSAMRPGMAVPAQLGRRLDVPTVNLGFAGSARMEPALGDLLAELDPRVLVLDCLPNMAEAELVAQRVGPLVRTVRRARPRLPIVLTEDRTLQDAWLQPELLAGHDARRQALRGALAGLRREGVRGLHLLGHEELLGDDGEATVDGSHPTDLGMSRYADAYEPLLRRLL